VLVARLLFLAIVRRTPALFDLALTVLDLVLTVLDLVLTVLCTVPRTSAFDSLQRHLLEATRLLTGRRASCCGFSFVQRPLWDDLHSIRPGLTDALLAETLRVLERLGPRPAVMDRLAALRTEWAAAGNGNEEADALLPHERILNIKSAAVAVGLHESREALLAGIPPEVRASLSTSRVPGEQVLLDLANLNLIGRLDEERVPLEIWLKNAIALTHFQMASSAFEEALAELSGRFPVPAGAGRADMPA
jgi:hypothetical protein